MRDIERRIYISKVLWIGKEPSEVMKEQLGSYDIKVKEASGLKRDNSEYDLNILRYSHNEEFFDWLTNLKLNNQKYVVISDSADEQMVYLCQKYGCKDIIKSEASESGIAERIKNVIEYN